MTVKECLEGKNIFITGGTGFIGKCLIEKLLRSIPNIGTIYLLLRSKKGKTPVERLSNFFDDPLFDKLRESFPEPSEKIVLIDGDLQKPKLGITEEKWKILIDNVNVIYHSAASVRFDVPLISAILTNVRSTRDIAELALQTKYLDVFIYISSTYGNSDKDVVEEKLYPSHGEWKEVIRLAEEGDRTIIEYLSEKYIHPLPNTYLYAKAISEHIVNDLCRGKIPAVIVRPSIEMSPTNCGWKNVDGKLVPTWFVGNQLPGAYEDIVITPDILEETSNSVANVIEEPIPGWSDNLNGPTGLLFAVCTGIMRVTLCDIKTYIDVVPVDAVANFLILVAVESLKNPDMEEIKVFNNSKHCHHKIDFQVLSTLMDAFVSKGTINEMIWYPGTKLVVSRLQYRFLAMIYHILPAILIDGLLRISGNKPRLFQIQKKIFVAQLFLAPFMMKSWTFKNEKAMALEKILTEEEVPIFGFIEKINWVYTNVAEYLETSCIGSQKYIFKNEVNLEKNKKTVKRFWALSIITRILFYLFLIWFILRSDIHGDLYNRVENYMSSL